MDHRQHGGQSVGERVEPPPEVDDDDHPARHRGDEGEGPGLAGDGAAEIGDSLEEKVTVAGQRLRELAELSLGNVRLEIGPEHEIRVLRSGSSSASASEDLEACSGVGNARGLEHLGEFGADDLGDELGAGDLVLGLDALECRRS